MAKKSFIKIYRDIFDSPLWIGKRVYSRFEAYIDLSRSADIKQHTLSISLRTLADRWGWSLGKVQRFLDLLHKKNYINYTVGKTALIKVFDTPSDTLTDTPKHLCTESLQGVTDTPTDTLSDTPTDTLSRAYKNDNNNIMSNGENKEEKECISNDIHKKDKLSCTPHDEKESFSLWLKKNYPRVSGMKKPLTLDDFKKLQSAGFNDDAIFSILSDMENWAKLNTKVSAYLTALKWLRKG